MKCNIQMTSVIIIGTLILCSVLLTAHSAPTPEQRPQEVVSITQDSPQMLSSDASQHRRSKRAIIFRPLFVYRQQQIQKQHVRDGLNLPKSNPYKQDIDNYTGQLPAAFFI